MFRSDAVLIRAIARTHSPATAAEWQTPPLVLLPGEGFGRYLIEHESDLAEGLPIVERLPWDDAVFDLPLARRELLDASGLELDRGQCWVRVRTLPRLLRDVDRSSPWLSGPANLLAPFRANAARWLVVEAWESYVNQPGGDHGFPLYPDVSLVPRDNPWTFGTVAHLYPNPDCRPSTGRAFGMGFCNVAACLYPRLSFPCHSSELVMSAGVRLATLILAYLIQSDEYPVEVMPAPPKLSRKPDPRIGEKPWLKEYLPHVILIDPHRVREYRPEPGTDDGTHASPSPHQRRGHWRQLRAERFREKKRVWVRPAWVGDRAWTAGGQVYRVLTDLGQV